MQDSNTTNAPFDYLKGRGATNKLKKLFKLEKDSELAAMLGVPKGTLATWHQRNLTPYELIIRACLITGASVEALALGKGELYDNENMLEQLLVMPAKRIAAGEMTDLPITAIDKSLLPEQFINENLTFVVTDNGRYIIDCSHSDIIQGRYIIEIEGKYSLNPLQRIPDNKIAIMVMDIPIIVKKEKINLIGKVITSIKRE